MRDPAPDVADLDVSLDARLDAAIAKAMRALPDA